jgi:hypothetical protein
MPIHIALALRQALALDAADANAAMGTVDMSSSMLETA